MPRTGTISLSQGDVERLTHHQRNMLIDHIDGELDVSQRDSHSVLVRKSLIGIGMLRGSPQHSIRPRATALTERGRLAVGMVLGNYADALVRAGALAPSQILLDLKTRQKSPVSAVTALAPVHTALAVLKK